MIEFDEEIFREVCLKTGHAPIEQNRRFIINHLFIRNYLELASQKEEANKGNEEKKCIYGREFPLKQNGYKCSYTDCEAQMVRLELDKDIKIAHLEEEVIHLRKILNPPIVINDDKQRLETIATACLQGFIDGNNFEYAAEMSIKQAKALIKEIDNA